MRDDNWDKSELGFLWPTDRDLPIFVSQVWAMSRPWWCADHNSGLSLVEGDHMTGILASDWPPWWCADHSGGLWLVESDHVIRILASDWSPWWCADHSVCRKFPSQSRLWLTEHHWLDTDSGLIADMMETEWSPPPLCPLTSNTTWVEMCG